MLRVAVFLALVAVGCVAQTRPVIPETFASSGEYEFHDTRGTFFGMFVLDRDQTTNEGVENATFKVGDATEHYEKLERFDMGEIFTIRSDGKGDVHCQKEVGNGSLPQYWAWLVDATYLGKFTYHEVDYDAWGVYVSGVEVIVAVSVTDANTPVFLTRRMGPIISSFQFKTFTGTTPPSADFNIPRECQGG